MVSITKAEANVLFQTKVHSGKDSLRARVEVETLKAFERSLSKKNIEIKGLNRQIEKLNTQILKLDEKLNKKKEDKFKVIFRDKIEDQEERLENPKQNGKLATTRDLNRILGLIETESEVRLSELPKAIYSTKEATENAISFLLRLNIIKKKVIDKYILISKNNETLPNNQQ